LHGRLTKTLKYARADFECDLLHPNIWLQQMCDNLLNIGQLLSSLLWVLADKGCQEDA
jgi:hypothetical protein